MCGLVGFWECVPRSRDESYHILDSMTDALRHRGPDDRGIWFDEQQGMGLGHRRLSIIDLSQSGHQPMCSHSDCSFISYNGEIYNTQELKSTLGTRINWRGGSDTEVLLECLDRWGVEQTLPQLNGMFAFAFWNRSEQTLTLVRDRLGIKPLYYQISTQRVLFSSELKGMTSHPNYDDELNRQAVGMFLRHSYIPSPCSIDQKTCKLRPGHCLTIRKTKAGFQWKEECWWNLSNIIESQAEDRCSSSEEEVSLELQHLIADAAQKRLVSDVPVGAFLSGGIDSSTLVGLLSQNASAPLRTFTIGFHEQDYNEAVTARKIARHFQTDHVEQYVSAEMSQQVIPELPLLYDEPFADLSQIPTYLVSRLARESVTVALSGDGGDELFGGYQRYRTHDRIWKQIGWLPRSLRVTLGKILKKISVWGGKGTLFRKGRLLGMAMQSRDGMELYDRLHRHWKMSSEVAMGIEEPPPFSSDFPCSPKGIAYIEQMMWRDSLTYLPDDILTKVDRASMAVGLEVRVPLLDHRIVEKVWGWPQHLKLEANQTKKPLRRILATLVPGSILNAKKQGFGVPMGDWLKGPLRDWAESLISEDRLKREGIFHPIPIRAKWEEHLDGKADWHYYLWDVLMFQLWYEARKSSQV